MEDRKFTDPEYFEHWSEDLWEGAPMDRIAVPSGWLYRDDICSDTWRVVYVPDYWADHVVEYREQQKAKHGAKLKDDREDDLRAKAKAAEARIADWQQARIAAEKAQKAQAEAKAQAKVDAEMAAEARAAKAARSAAKVAGRKVDSSAGDAPPRGGD